MATAKCLLTDALEDVVAGGGGQTVLKRPIIVDACNVGHSAAARREFVDCRALTVILRHFIARGYKATTYIPITYNNDERADVRYATALQTLNNLDLLTFTAARKLDAAEEALRPTGGCVKNYDDLYMVQRAHHVGGVLISNDRYDDIAAAYEQWRVTVHRRLRVQFRRHRPNGLYGIDRVSGAEPDFRVNAREDGKDVEAILSCRPNDSDYANVANSQLSDAERHRLVVAIDQLLGRLEEQSTAQPPSTAAAAATATRPQRRRLVDADLVAPEPPAAEAIDFGEFEHFLSPPMPAGEVDAPPVAAEAAAASAVAELVAVRTQLRPSVGASAESEAEEQSIVELIDADEPLPSFLDPPRRFRPVQSSVAEAAATGETSQPFDAAAEPPPPRRRRIRLTDMAFTTGTDVEVAAAAELSTERERDAFRKLVAMDVFKADVVLAVMQANPGIIDLDTLANLAAENAAALPSDIVTSA